MKKKTINDSESPRAVDDVRVRSVLEAAADTAPPTSPPPFFAARVLARAAVERPAASSFPVAIAAARLLPIFAVVAFVLAGIAGYESMLAANEREAAIARALASGAGSDVLIGAVLLSNPSEPGAGGSR